MADDAFCYGPLDPRVSTLRLLRLKGGCDRILEGELTETLLDDNIQPYEAVSYTWGNNRKADFVRIGSKRLPITLNLSLIMRDLRHPDEDRVLWIDAICINQDHDDEKSHQVQQMKHVYERATRVLFCICRPTELTDFWVMLAGEFEQQVVAAGVRLEDWATTWKRMEGEWAGKHFACRVRQHEALSFMFEQAWFYRVWILQEVANSRDALVYCGRLFLSAATFVVTTQLTGYKPSEHCRAILDLMPRPTRGHKKTERTFYELLRLFKDVKATDQRDKIIALLGLCSDGEGFEISYSNDFHTIIRQTICRFRHIDLQAISTLTFKSVSDFLERLPDLNDILTSHFLEASDINSIICLMDLDGVHIDSQLKDPFGRSFLGMAVRSDNEDAVSFILSNHGRENINAADNHRRTPLLEAARHGNSSIVKLLVDEGMKVIQGTSWLDLPLDSALVREHTAVARFLTQRGAKSWRLGRSALLDALWMGDTKLVESLIDQGADMEAIDSDGGSPLCEASAHGLTRMVQVLLCKGALVNFTRQGHLPLYLALCYGRLDVVQLLITHGADVNGPTESNLLHQACGRMYNNLAHLLRTKPLEGVQEFDWHPLEMAVRSRHLDIVRYLVAHGADKERKCCAAGTPLFLAESISRPGKDPFVKFLFEQGADLDPDCRCSSQDTPLLKATTNGLRGVAQILIDKGADVEKPDASGETPLHRAAANGHHGMVDGLLLNGADVEAPDHRGERPLHRAAASGHQWVVDVLLKYGANIEAPDCRGEKPLHRAAANGHYMVLNVLLENGADIEAPDPSGERPLTIAAALLFSSNSNTAKAMVLLLLRHGAAANTVSPGMGETALLQVIEHGALDMIEELIRKGANIEVQDASGNTPLLRAAEYRRRDVAMALLRNGADLEATNYSGETPLMRAAASGDLELVGELVNRGMSLEARDRNGVTASQHAGACGHDVIERLLDPRRADHKPPRPKRQKVRRQ